MMYTPSVEKEVDVNIMYIGGPKVCRKCGIATSKFYYKSKTAKSVLCCACKYELFPPKIALQILVNSVFKGGELYNPYTRTYEHTFGLIDFVECGWFIRRRIIYNQDDQMNNQVRNLFARNGSQWSNWVKEVIHLEYYGKRKCKRVPNYKFFPDDASICPCVYCRESTY